jgi:hypothetical protein
MLVKTSGINARMSSRGLFDLVKDGFRSTIGHTRFPKGVTQALIPI